MMNDETPIYATRTPEGAWRITGSRVSLDSVVHAYWDGRMPEAIVADFPSLTLEQVHGAIAFYLRNRQEIDKHLQQQDECWRQFQQQSAMRHGPLLQRIRGAANAATPAGS